MFFIALLILIVTSTGYIGFRMIHPAPFSMATKFVLWILLIGIPQMIPMMFIIRRSGRESDFTDLFGWIGYTGSGFLSLVLAFLFFRDILWVLLSLSDQIIRFFRIGINPEGVFRFHHGLKALQYSNGIILVLAVMFTVYGLYEAKRIPDIRKVDVPIEHLPKAFNGFRIVQVSDIHVSCTVKKRDIERIVQLIGKLQPDCVVITGDLVDGSVARLGNDISPLSRIHAPSGVYFVTGNHEYYSGAAEWIKEIRRIGIDVLMNEYRIIMREEANILIAGVPDIRGGRFLSNHVSNPEKAISGAPSVPVSILLAHQPKSVIQASKAGFNFMISGHTHGGQFFPWNYLVRWVYPYPSGLSRMGNTLLYVSRGTGYWGPPLRIGSPSEVTLFILKTDA